ncbi:MAG: hypothetical protein K0R54_4363 [Clostridiaceae bacterium]|nr:hypothetical protein [Clostridiaceae bacterium]
MFKRNDGKEYESLIKYVYDELSSYSKNDIKVERNIKLVGKSGCEHQIDVYYEFLVNGITHKVVIECKDHKKKVEKMLIQAFESTLNDIGGCNGIFASRNGFQKGALDYAKFARIELVSGGELPLLSRVLIRKIEEFLPDEKVIGQPFWTIMEEDDGRLTGIYNLISENTIGLFTSKKMAEDFCIEIGGVVRGVSQKHLKYIIQNGYNFGLNVCLFFLDASNGFIVEPRLIEDYFVIL